MFNSLSSNLSIYFGMTGGNLVIASACASAASAIGLGTLMIRHGYADVVLAGGADSCLTPAMFACWTKLRVMAQHDVPQKASRPFDAHRNGMVLGEGGAMLVLESRKSAERRAVEPLGKICGVGTSSDAHHITSPTLLGQRTAIGRCLADAGISPAEVDYLNAHGTGTRANDETEGQAIVEVFGPRGPGLPVSSTKSMIGHSLGASGAIELVVCMHAARNEFVPPTLNCDEPEPAVGVDFVPNTGRPHRVKFAMSNSFAFGGNNVSLLTQRLL
jgi:3-oxoacyl-[acyl-carrier-protein] synthase II